MDRKDFVKKTILGAAGIAAGSRFKVKPKASTYDKMMEQVGFNHIPNKEVKTMKSVLHKAETRGHANHGWLDTHHTFSFANYYNPERMHFGVLRVLNDDVVDGGKGFPTHPHDNMEIISIPLEGDLEHKDSMNNKAVIRNGDVQVMSAGTGVFHSEYNKNSDAKVRFLQIWMFPNRKNVDPRYDQITLDTGKMKNAFMQILSPNPNDDGVWVHQNAWWHMADLEAGTELDYQVRSSGNGVYTFVIDGDVSVEGQELGKRDGFGVWDTDELNFKAKSNARVLVMDVPMTM